MSSQPIEWCGVLVTTDDAIKKLFEMPAPDDDPQQQPEFRVTSSTAELVGQDFERYQLSLARMAESWQQEKACFMREKKASSSQDNR